MCNCFSTTFLPHSFGFTTSELTHKIPHLLLNLRFGNNRNQLASDCFKLGKAKKNLPNSSLFDSDGYEFSDDLWLKDKEETEIPLSAVDKGELVKNGADYVDLDSKLDRLEKGIVRRRKQMMKRSNMIAKQVISIRSALSLGFVSQLWVDINSWIVFLVEVRPNLLSGEVEKFLLEDVKQVGDVVLIEDESVMENEFKLVGLQTLVGYNVVTPRQRNIGKVRGYTFNINSGAVESLELDCLGISIIPSSLVSTYCLFVEDVVDVLSDTIVVQEAAASHLQRLTKGFWDAQKMAYSADEMEDYSVLRNPHTTSQNGRSRKTISGKKLRKKIKELTDDWELPMDFF
ncbi:uncharacterized protein [Nicotiana tomentosiformis]|uniref:uncharacterized protein isoform X1 n=1 Tax=Nicotiana tomentosiformis TaxID=4098 RepID=UPI00051B53F2|nr:uncharacterized protein LOC104108403 isoform X1 [Nicotiana tomentosiformis]